MNGEDAVERQMVATAAVILRQGDRIDALSRGLTLASLVGSVGLAMLAGRAAVPTLLLIGTASLAGLAELWFAGRVAADAGLFRHLSCSPAGPDWALLDKALTGVGLLPAAKAGRVPRVRIAGAFRLLRLQTAALVVQFGLVLAGAAVSASR